MSQKEKIYKPLHDKMLIFGRMMCKYKIEQNLIDDINQKYESALKKTNTLKSHGPHLVGRLDSELGILPILQRAKIFKKITQCMSDYIDTAIEHGLCKPGPHNLDILSCWVNDMKPGEYNPIHTHNKNVGYSSNLYLKIPEFINDCKDPHKWVDGKISFIAPDATKLEHYTPKVGEFYIFQADHMHCVHPFKTKDPNAIRRSMPINFVINNTIKGKEINV
jgi:hypothetical protein